jgi:hypothetical protein
MSATEKLYTLVKAEPPAERYPEPEPLVAGQGHDRYVWEHMKESGARNGVSIASIKKVFKDWRQTGKQFDKNHPFHEDNAEFGTATGRYPYTYVPWEPEDEQYNWYPSDDVILTKHGELRKIKWGEDVPQWKRFAHLGLSQTRHFPRGVRTSMARVLLHRNRTGASKPSEKELERIKNDPELLEDYARYTAEQGRALTDYDIDSNRIPALNRRAVKNYQRGLNPHPESSNYVAPPFTQTHTPISQHDIENERYRIMGYSPSERHNLRMERLGIQPGELAEQFIHGFEGTQPSDRGESAPTPTPTSVTPPPAALSPEESSDFARYAGQGGNTPAGGRPVKEDPEMLSGDHPQNPWNRPRVNDPRNILNPDSESTIEDKPVTKKPPSDEEEGTQLPLDLLLKFVTA